MVYRRRTDAVITRTPTLVGKVFAITFPSLAKPGHRLTHA
jgi:hypothetical protein